ncbi:MAG: putative pectin lyase [Verrucomicrobiales bacterium]|nr:putative pectin lyase [Verrucomicrobiales bacterium]
MKISLLLVFIFLACTSGQTAAQKELFVAPDGRDTNPGTKRKPFAMLERARDELRKSKKNSSSRSNGATIWIRGGTYLLKKGFALAAEDSGQSNAPIVYRAFQHEQPCFVGGIELSMLAFHPVTDPAVLKRLDESARTNILQIDLRQFGLNDFGAAWPNQFRGYNGWPELFFGAKPMHLARWPNTGFARMGVVLDSGTKPRFGEKPDRPGKITYEGNRPERWLASDEVFLDGFWSYKWYNEVLKVAKIFPREKSILFSAPHWYGVGGPSGGDFYALNLLEELDAPEEYYLDRKTGILYFWPPKDYVDSTNKNPSPKIALSLLQASMVSFTNVSNVTLQGLLFEGSRGAAITVSNGRDVLVTNCIIRNLATDAVAISGGEHNGIVDCEIYGIGGAGISLDGGNRTNLISCGNYADNNHIHHFGRLFRTHKDAIFLSGCGCRATHNLIHDAPHHAMDFTGNDHLMEFNEIHHVCMETDDAAAIYTGRHWSVQGNIIRYNFIHEIGGGPTVGNQAIYLDDAAAGTTCFGNVISQTARAFLLGGGRDNIIQNNIIVDCPVPIFIDNRGIGFAATHDEDWTTLTTDLKSMPYKEEPWKSRYPYLLDYLDNRPGYPVRNVVEQNLIVRCGEMQLAQEARDLGTVRNNFSTNADPGFADAVHLNFLLKANATVYKELPGFKPVPVEQIGLKKSSTK